MKFGGTIIIESADLANDVRENLERRVLRRSASTAGDGRLIVVNCGIFLHRERFKQWLDGQDIRYTLLSCDKPA